MPIRFVDRAATIVGRVTTTLAEAAANFDGTFTAAAARTGSIVAQLQDMAGAVRGIFQANANRVGTISSTLAGHAAAFRGPANTTALEADWRARIAGVGVVWYHDFRTAAEVNQFRWANAYGQDPLDQARPGQTTWVADDGITGGCLESRHNASGPPNPPDWWRPMCPLNAASNGRGIADPAAGGSLTLRSFSPTDGGDELLDLNNVGQYGPAAYHGDASFDGTEYWLQMRVKISANRVNTGSGPDGDEGGKILYFTNTRRSNSDQELVTNSYYNVGGLGPTDANLFQMYRSGGTGLVDDDPGNGRQVGGEYNGGVCTSSPLNDSGCWFWPTDETSEGEGRYVTLLYQIIPGLDDNADSVVRVWKAEWGETSYTKIWDQANVDLFYDNDMPRGHNAIILSGYQNQISFSEEIWHRYAQVIFSKNTIPCPQVYDETPSSALAAACVALASGQSASFAPGLLHGLNEAQLEWQGRFLYDPVHNVVHLFGKQANDDNDWRQRTYDLATSTWANNDFDFNRPGHVYASVDIDPSNGDLYYNPGTTDNRLLYRWAYATAAWTLLTSDIGAGSVNGPNGVAWHPNLYGIGDGGLVTRTAGAFLYYRKSNGAVQRITGTTQGTSPQGCYFQAIDKVVLGRANHWTIAPNGGSTPILTDVGAPPIQTMGTASQTNCGVVLQHPGNPSKLILLEKTGTNRYWTSTDGDNWTLVGTHPFVTASGSPVTFCSLGDGLGCIWGIGSTNVLTSVLWRPPV
jgi:hypothetical protein